MNTTTVFKSGLPKALTNLAEKLKTKIPASTSADIDVVRAYFLVIAQRLKIPCEIEITTSKPKKCLEVEWMVLATDPVSNETYQIATIQTPTGEKLAQTENIACPSCGKTVEKRTATFAHNVIPESMWKKIMSACALRWFTGCSVKQFKILEGTLLGCVGTKFGVGLGAATRGHRKQCPDCEEAQSDKALLARFEHFHKASAPVGDQQYSGVGNTPFPRDVIVAITQQRIDDVVHRVALSLISGQFRKGKTVREGWEKIRVIADPSALMGLLEDIRKEAMLVVQTQCTVPIATQMKKNATENDFEIS